MEMTWKVMVFVRLCLGILTDRKWMKLQGCIGRDRGMGTARCRCTLFPMWLLKWSLILLCLSIVNLLKVSFHYQTICSFFDAIVYPLTPSLVSDCSFPCYKLSRNPQTIATWYPLTLTYNYHPTPQSNTTPPTSPHPTHINHPISVPIP